MELIDTHCHLTELSVEELKAQLERAELAGVKKMICIGAGYGVEAAFRAVKLAESYPNIWASVGIHPHDATAKDRFGELEELALHPKVVAIGETGLDYFREWSPYEDQRALFRSSIQLAIRVQKPLVIHCREAREDTFRLLSEEGAEQVGGVFHCYSEDFPFAEKLHNINFITSFPGSLTFKKATALRETARQIPFGRIMLETDAPYMAPEPFRGKTSEPAHVLRIAEVLAETKGVSLEAIAEETTKTAKALFKIPN